MNSPKSDHVERERRILDAAAALIMRHGYDKTTMSDVAEEVGVSRGIVYLHFDSKESLLEALIHREVLQYVQTWLEHIEADPRGGTIGGIYRAVLYAINNRPFMSAVMKRDRRIIGNYLQKPNNMFKALQTPAISVGFLEALQAAGAIRKDVNLVMMSHIMDMVSYGLLTIGDFRPLDELPPYEAVMEALADMMDRLMTPEDGLDSEAGKAVIRQLAAAARAQFEQPQQSTEK
ncbi:MAG: TetR/AcrR family transcriptional regulator [Anaerolineae bacterium]|nr:TetR/AcrR family transcriptional regulator [Anaerolineae bacterium]